MSREHGLEQSSDIHEPNTVPDAVREPMLLQPNADPAQRQV